MTERLSRADDPAGAHARAAAALAGGGLAIVPTDTVYVLVADAFQPAATRRQLDVKGRGRSSPLTVLVRSPRQVSGLAVGVTEPAERLMAAYWPGPLTLVLDAVEGLTWDLGDARGSVATRMPADDCATDLIAEVGPLAATGVAPVDGRAADSLDELVERFGDEVSVVIDDGPRGQMASTVVDVTKGRVRTLRVGAVAAEHVRQVAEGVVGWGERPATVTRETKDDTMRIAIGSDHAGFGLKRHLVGFLAEQGHEVTDHGTDSEESVDYPPFCAEVARAVASGTAERGIVLGGTGQGEQIASNKVRGVRAALCHDLYTARLSREHNDATVLAIGGRIVAAGLAEEIVTLWLSTAFSGGRHQRRIEQINEIEEQS